MVDAPSRRALRGSRLLSVACALVLLPVAGFFLGLPWYLDPVRDPVPAPGQADAIVALGGIEGSAERAYALAAAGVAPTLLIADPYGDEGPPVVRRLCRSDLEGVEISCFTPEPSTTRGEAQEIRRLAEAGGWDRVVVVTATYHLVRAEWIIDRCVEAELAMVDAGADFGAATWAYHYGYQSAGWLRALSQRGC